MESQTEYWSEYYRKYYNLYHVLYYYQNRSTLVMISPKVYALSVCQKGDKWNFKEGFYTAYIKALKKGHAKELLGCDKIYANVVAAKNNRISKLNKKTASLINQIKKMTRKTKHE